MSLPTRIFPLILFIAIGGICTHARATLDLTAEFAPVAGLPGYESYRITATSDLGNIVGCDFSTSGNYGITGPMNQLSSYGRATVYQDSLFAGIDPLQDSHFLINCTDVLSLFPEESATGLHGAFALIGDRQLTIGNSVPFLQVVTPSAADVILKGSLIIRRSDDSYIQLAINTKLADIAVGPAPGLTVLPVPPPEPTITPQQPVQPATQIPSSAGGAPPALPSPAPTPLPASGEPAIEVPPQNLVVSPEPGDPYFPDVVLGYGRPFLPLLPPTPEQLQALINGRLDVVPSIVRPTYNNGLITIFSYAEDSDPSLESVQIAQFNSNEGFAAAMGSNLELVNASNSSTAPEPSTCVLILLGTVCYALTSLQRCRD